MVQNATVTLCSGIEKTRCKCVPDNGERRRLRRRLSVEGGALGKGVSTGSEEKIMPFLLYFISK